MTIFILFTQMTNVKARAIIKKKVIVQFKAYEMVDTLSVEIETYTAVNLSIR